MSVLCSPAVCPVPGTVPGTWRMLSACLGDERSGEGAQTELQENGERWKARK